MILDRIVQLVAKKLGNELSAGEEEELEGLLQQHPDYHTLVETLQAIQFEKHHQEPVWEEDQLVRESWLALQQQLDTPVKRLFPRWISRVAVCAALLLLGGGIFFAVNQSAKKESTSAAVSQVKVPNGMRVKKILPDSSVVWLNAGSLIRYDSSFTQPTRDVYLEGEAYFNVAKDEDHPFVVHAGNITVQALGTEFNVQAYHDENKIEATLISGKVVVKIDGKPDDDIVLAPNEKLTVSNSVYSLAAPTAHAAPRPEQAAIRVDVKAVSELEAIAAVPEIAWLQDKLAFENQRFDELAKRMERRYDIHIRFEDAGLQRERLSGVFEKENIRNALDLLKMTTPFRYRIQGDTVYIKN